MTWAYTWDVNNRMVAAVKSAGSNLYTVDYKYDVFGNRIEQAEDVDGAGATASVTTRFAWEGAKVLQDAWGGRTAPIGTEDWNIWADLDGSNGLKVRYVRGDEVDQLFCRVKADGTVASYLPDRMGSVRQMVDASGSLANTITYDGFGNVLSETDAAFGDRWKWTGREGNSYTGLQYNRARYYSGESGRWASEDPIRIDSYEYNYYRMSANNGTNILDPSGLLWQGKKDWKNRKLTWEDYKKVDKTPSGSDASTHPTIENRPKTHTEKKPNGTIGIHEELEVGLNKEGTFVKKDKVDDDYLLSHEQNHYDLAVLVLVRIKEELA